MHDDSFLRALIGDGRPALRLVAVILIGSGFFAIGQAATGQFLPHDTEYLGLTAKQLCSLHGCRIVHFMIHDRISFGGVLVAIGVMYLWLIEFPPGAASRGRGGRSPSAPSPDFSASSRTSATAIWTRGTAWPRSRCFRCSSSG